MILRIRPMAEVDLEEIALRIGSDRPESAKRFLFRAARTFELLARLPQLGASRMIDAYPDARIFSIRRFRNYVVLYLPLPDGVEILRIVDGRRDLPSLFDQVD
jgi:toxin ParE1/3/4